VGSGKGSIPRRTGVRRESIFLYERLDKQGDFAWIASLRAQKRRHLWRKNDHHDYTRRRRNLWP